MQAKLRETNMMQTTSTTVSILTLEPSTFEEKLLSNARVLQLQLTLNYVFFWSKKQWTNRDF